MPATKYDLEARQGDTFRKTFTLKEDDGTPVDVTGYSAEFSFALTPGSETSFTYTDASGHFAISGSDGQFSLTVPADETVLWNDKRYVYEFTITDPSGVKLTLIEGKFLVDPEVVR